jgi:cysteine desulfurase
MIDPSRYFDHAATSPMHIQVVEAMLPFMTEHFGNPHAIHSAGTFLGQKVQEAREEIAALLCAENPESIIFTSGATESNNWILKLNPEMAISPFEHSSVLKTAQGSARAILPTDGYTVDTDHVDSAGITLVSNETGGIPNLTRRPKVLHRDITQGIGYVPIHLDDFDFASSSLHKIGGPTGIGIMFARDPYTLSPMLIGGGQEFGLRSGTVSVPLVVGAAEAVKIAILERETRVQSTIALRQLCLDYLHESGVHFGTDPVNARSPHILSVNFPGVEGQTTVLEMDHLGWMISAGAACSSHEVVPSHTLLSLGYSEEHWRSTIRISFGPSNSPENCLLMMSDLIKYIKKVQICN